MLLTLERLPNGIQLIIPRQDIAGGAHSRQICGATLNVESSNHGPHQPFDAQLQAFSMHQPENIEDPSEAVSSCCSSLTHRLYPV